MDDDTIPQPDALENMIPYTQVEKVGFICSEVVWIDGSSHMMNQAKLLSDQSMKSQILSPVGKSSENVELAEMASFVSLLINGDIPWKLGLPYKEFFIWCDDAEYTKRITSNGYYGLYVKNSIALHKTGENYVSSLHTVPASASWKIYYGVRNDSFLRRKKKGWVRFFFSQLNCFRTHAHRIKKRHLPKDEELKLLKANNRGLIDGFLFNPQIEYLQE
jgi:GT2 family glycosyltransferase